MAQRDLLMVEKKKAIDQKLAQLDRLLAEKDRRINYIHSLWFHSVILISEKRGSSQESVLLEFFEREYCWINVWVNGRKISYTDFFNKEKRRHTSFWQSLQECVGCERSIDTMSLATEVARMRQGVITDVHSAEFQIQPDGDAALIIKKHTKVVACFLKCVVSEVAAGILLSNHLLLDHFYTGFEFLQMFDDVILVQVLTSR